MGSSFVTGFSLLRIRIQPEDGGRFPHGRVLDSPLPLSDLPLCTPSYPVPPNSLLICRACPIQKFCGSGCCLPLPVPRSPQTLLLFIRAGGKDLFFPWEPTPVFHTAPMPQPHEDVPIMGAGVEQRRLPIQEGSQRQWAEETLTPFPAPSSSLIKTCL